MVEHTIINRWVIGSIPHSGPIELFLISHNCYNVSDGACERSLAVMAVEGRKEMFLFNDALNTFYSWLYGIRHMVKDHSDSERGNPLPPHRLLFPISSKGSLICIIPQTG